MEWCKECSIQEYLLLHEEIPHWHWLLTSLATKGHFLQREGQGQWAPWQCSMHWWHANFVGISSCHRFATYHQHLRLSSGLCYTSCRFLVGPLPWLFLNLYVLSWNGGRKNPVDSYSDFFLMPITHQSFLSCSWLGTLFKSTKNPKEVKIIQILSKF